MPQNDWKSTFCCAKYGVCLNSGSHRKIEILNITIESIARMKIGALLVSFHEQNLSSFVCLILFPT
jgi:hypothetical protein